MSDTYYMRSQFKNQHANYYKTSSGSFRKFDSLKNTMKEISAMYEIAAGFEEKRSYFDDGHTKSLEFRLSQLRSLRAVVRENEERILEALHKDLRKPAFEAYTAEIGVLYTEIRYALRNLKRWMKPEKTRTPLVFQPSSSSVHSEPLGIVLIIGPWNYPINLLLIPLVGAIAAGNCAILKPSYKTPHTSKLIAEMVSETFEHSYISAVQGPGASVGPELIERYRFDHIFFSGSAGVGRVIAEMAGRFLTPVTLELGGKSPVVVDRSANIKVAARRLAWAKFFNAGQTCICPDYLLVHESVRDELISSIKEAIHELFGDDPIKSESYGRIVSEKRIDDLARLLERGTIIMGGRVVRDEKYVEPTIIGDVTVDDPIMEEEIFGPILPVLTFNTLEEVVGIVRKNRHPLSFYVFTESPETENYLIENLEFGGGCVNNCMVHFASTFLPFGGVASSGMGSYHGKASYDLFSHRKAIVRTSTLIDPALNYAPYDSKKMALARLFMR
jgi:aldehyde dehydrogenase (NAD+)